VRIGTDVALGVAVLVAVGDGVNDDAGNGSVAVTAGTGVLAGVGVSVGTNKTQEYLSFVPLFTTTMTYSMSLCVITSPSVT
jgi:hypothetical protein